MARTENDSWDLASGVGVTATLVAAARALATRRRDPLVNDPFAEPLVRAVGITQFIRALDGDLPDGYLDDAGVMLDVIAVRTAFFDDFLLDSAAGGIRQAVILAAGLDSRAYRLPWPADMTVFEIDQPGVIDFKSRTLAELVGDGAAAGRRAVAIDLREDWPAALRRAGFDTAAPTAWIAEGLLAYLPPEAQDRLFDNIDALSAPGSRIATEHHPDGGAGIAQSTAALSTRWAGEGLSLNLGELFAGGERRPVADHLDELGWTVDPVSRAAMFAHYGRSCPEDPLLQKSVFVTATRTSARRVGDTWDLASGVGATATAVATSRALATRDGLIDDRWAEPLVRAVGKGHFLAILDNPEAHPEQHRMTLGLAVRTRYFDDFLVQAGAAGIGQVVILASGLDSRAYRLAWPPGTVVFDLDQAGVIDLKAAALARLGARPTAEVRNVGVDLREDWPAALRDNGFDAGRPTAWIAEGLLMYLPPEAQDRLFDHITAISAAGSRLATEFTPDMAAFTATDDDGESRWRRMGFKDDLAGLVYPGDRSHVIDYLTGLDWTVAGRPVRELFDHFGIEHVEDDMTERFQGFQYVSAELS